MVIIGGLAVKHSNITNVERLCDSNGLRYEAFEISSNRETSLSPAWRPEPERGSGTKQSVPGQSPVLMDTRH
jgi:hypothetical protein